MKINIKKIRVLYKLYNRIKKKKKYKICKNINFAVINMMIQHINNIIYKGSVDMKY